VLFIGDQWAPAAGALRLLCAVAAAGTIGTILGVSLAAKQRPGIPALFSWISIPFLAAGILVSARVAADYDLAGRLLAIAVATLAVQLLITGALGYIVFRRILRVSPRSTVLLGLPGLAAAGAAALAGHLTYQLADPALNRFFDLAVTGTVAAVTGLLVLLGLDRGARLVAAWLLGKLRRRPAPTRP